MEPQPIPLDAVYVTSEQEGPKRVTIVSRDFDRRTLEVLRERSRQVGLSNVFLVRGAKITDAIGATKVAFDLGIGAGEPIPADQFKNDENIWVVAFFGVSGSSPPAWVVRGVERAGGRVRVSFAHDEGRTRDVKPYFAWAPLGSLAAGTYTLDLYDVNNQEVTLSRTVRVAK